MAHSNNDARGSDDDPSPMDRSSTHDDDRDVPDPSALESNADESHNGVASDQSEEDSTEVSPDEDTSSMLGTKLATLSLVVGVILFLFPEPITSTLGLFLVAAGAGVWLYKLMT